MKTFLVPALLVLAAPARAQQPVPAAWGYSQELTTPAPGVYKYKLPLEALDVSQPGLGDLRLVTPDGHEVPYLLEAARPSVVRAAPLPDFKSKLEGNKTILTARAEGGAYMDSLFLDTPAGSFIKPVDVYLSQDGRQWTKVREGAPVFRQYCNSENLRVDIKAAAKYIKVVVDDTRAAPVPFTGLRALLLPRPPAALETLNAVIVSKEDYASSSRVTVRLPARNLYVFAVQLAVGDKLFSRNITVSARSLEDGSVVSRQLASDTIFATDAAGASASRTKVPVYAQFSGTDELVLDIDNGNSPALEISSVKAEYAPVFAVFQSKTSGSCSLLAGNRQAPARSYDLPGVARYLAGKQFSSPKAGPFLKNPAFSEAETLPKLETFGGAIDTGAWLYKSRVSVERSGVQGLDLGFPVVSRAQSDLRDLRLVSAGKQVPYILDRNYTMRSLAAAAEKLEDRGTVSVWKIKLPSRNFPLSQLTVSAPDTIFQRHAALYEPASDRHGSAYRRQLGAASWSNGEGGGTASYSMGIAAAPSGDEVELEVENGDNKPLELTGFKLSYPVSRVIFKWKGGGDLQLFYGNSEARYPAYDISIAARELLGSQKLPALLEDEPGGSGGWGDFKLSTTLSKAAFWAVLAAVAALLIFLIVRLLPPPPQSETK